jgi:hypothetical protein
MINRDEFVAELINNPASFSEVNFCVICDDSHFGDWFAVPTQH